MKNKKIVFGAIIFLFVMSGICSISNAWTDDFVLSSSSYRSYNLGYLNDGDIIKINKIDASDVINVYIMNDEQYNIVVSSDGLIWNYFIRWKDITYISGYDFDITIDDNYYIVFYNKGILFSRTVQIDISITDVIIIDIPDFPEPDKNIFWELLLFVAIPIVAIVLVITIPIILIRKHKKASQKEDIIIQKEEIPKITYCTECGIKIADISKGYCSQCGSKIT